jgi:hypothetical protein
MKRTVSTGPKRRRWRRRDWSGAGGIGQERRWGSTVGNFKAEREARRAGLTGKRGKHRGQGADPADALNPSHVAVYALMVYEQKLALLAKVTDPSRERATGEREADSDSLASQREEEREEE